MFLAVLLAEVLQSGTKAGSSIVVVRMLWEHIVRVRFSAPRPIKISQIFSRIFENVIFRDTIHLINN